VFARIRRDVDLARVTALIDKVTGPFGCILRHSAAFCVVASPAASRKSAPEWQPNGNHSLAEGRDLD
jgi:hypothetical protein